MPNVSLAVENNFRNALITEATGLNFPENAVTETYDCQFNIDGSVSRRLGFDFEEGYETKSINRTGRVVVTYQWHNVSGNGDLALLVVQVGDTLYFYKTNGDNLSSFSISDTIVMTAVSGAPTIDTVEAQFTDGNGYLFVTHPYCEPFKVSYNPDTEEVDATDITVQIRDFEGDVDDPYDVTTRPTSTLAALDVHHKYNLYNQGWNTTNLTAWDTAQTTMPSNADVMWRFKDSSDDFDASSTAIARVNAGNTPATHGHFIVSLFDQDRDTASGLSGITSTTTGYQRPSTCTFFAGRIFYSGINAVGFNSSIYFSQIIERDEQLGFCYQTNDPTSEDLFDILPSDGGYINIYEAGTIYKLVAVPGGLCVFAERGVWFITGSTGLGFTAVDYTVQKIAEIPTLSASSFVNIGGYPSWWNVDGIYIIEAQGNFPNVKNISLGKIDTFYKNIPVASKRFAKGYYHFRDKQVRWIYRSEETTQVTETYEFDRILNFNVVTGGFFPWTVTDTDVKINAIIYTDIISRAISTNLVVDNSDVQIVDNDGVEIVSYDASGTQDTPFDKYLVSYPNSGTYEFTFASKTNADYVDWYLYDNSGVDFTSYFITGYKPAGGGIRFFQNNYIRIFSRLLNITDSISYFFQGIWDYAITGSGTGRWSARQHVSHTDTNYSTDFKRLKVRGRGVVLQFKVTSVPGQPFDILGWSSTQTVNTGT